MLFTSHNTPHITLGNDQCLKLLLGVCNTRKKDDLWRSLTRWIFSLRPMTLKHNFLYARCAIGLQTILKLY
jgi:hypothetical protein